MKKIVNLVAISLASSMLFGCGAGSGSSTKNDDKTITVMVESGSPAEALAKMRQLQSLKRRQGIRLILMR